MNIPADILNQFKTESFSEYTLILFCDSLDEDFENTISRYKLLGCNVDKHDTKDIAVAINENSKEIHIISATGIQFTNRCYGLFSNVRTKSIEFNEADFSNATNLAGLFMGSDIRYISLADIDLSAVTDMHEMFALCTNLESVDLSNTNTINVKDLSGMFDQCNMLKEVKLDNFRTDEVTNTTAMFNDCRNIKKIDVSSFNKGKLECTEDMFSNCSKLISVNMNKMDTHNVTNMKGMFYGCNLPSFNLGDLDFSSIETDTNIRQLIQGDSQTVVIFDDAKLPKVLQIPELLSYLSPVWSNRGLYLNAEQLFKYRLPHNLKSLYLQGVKGKQIELGVDDANFSSVYKLESIVISKLDNRDIILTDELNEELNKLYNISLEKEPNIGISYTKYTKNNAVDSNDIFKKDGIIITETLIKALDFLVKCKEQELKGGNEEDESTRENESTSKEGNERTSKEGNESTNKRNESTSKGENERVNYKYITAFLKPQPSLEETTRDTSLKYASNKEETIIQKVIKDDIIDLIEVDGSEELKLFIYEAFKQIKYCGDNIDITLVIKGNTVESVGISSSYGLRVSKKASKMITVR